MQLHRVMFRVDFPPAYGLFDRWGEVLARLDSNKLWTGLGETLTPRQIVAQRIDLEKGESFNLTATVNSVSGSLEKYPMHGLDEAESVLKDATALVTLLGITTFNRVGVRFIFLEEAKSFEVARSKMSKQIASGYTDAFEGELLDLNLVLVQKVADEYRRISVGPIAKKEYPAWFSMQSTPSLANAYITDVDVYTFEYRFKTFDLRKFADLALDTARKQSVAFMRQMSD